MQFYMSENFGEQEKFPLFPDIFPYKTAVKDKCMLSPWLLKPAISQKLQSLHKKGKEFDCCGTHNPVRMSGP